MSATAPTHPRRPDAGFLQRLRIINRQRCRRWHLADHYGVELEPAIVAKFNAVSVREGFPERIRG